MKEILNFLKDSGAKIRTTHPVRQIAAFTVFAVLMSIAFLNAVSRPDTNRSIFYFPDSLSRKDAMEVRHLPRLKTVDQRFNLYVQEMLLGPVHQERDPLFASSPRIISAFIRGREAYVNLSRDAEITGSENLEWEAVYRIFRKNVFTNFRNIARIYIYIDGQEVYAEEPAADARTKK